MFAERLLVAASLLVTPVAAGAQAVRGPYVSLGVGANFLQDEHFDKVILAGVATPRFNGPVSFDTGFAGVVSAGWGFGNGLRIELEGNYRYNDVHHISGAISSGGVEQKYGGMGNLFYDLDLGLPVLPYVGLGVGEQTLDWRNGRAQVPGTFVRLQHPDIKFAYQAILGAAYQLPVSGLALTAEYRFLGTTGGHTIYGQYFAPGLDRPAEARGGDEYNHSLMLGVRYAFNAAPPPVMAPVPAAPAQVDSRTYLVFFDWDRSDLTDRARQINAAVQSGALGSAGAECHVGAGPAWRAAGFDLGSGLRRVAAVGADGPGRA